MSEERNPTVQIKEADRVEITAVIDNYSDHTLPMSEPPSEMIKRAPPAVEGRIPSDALLAEHGLCLLVKIFKNEKHYSVLLDAGWSKVGVPHNIEMLGVDTSEIEAVVISHGHMDHFGALPDVLEIMASHGVSLIIHPDAFLPRALSLPTGAKIEMPVLKESTIQKTGVKVVKTRNPHSLASGLVFSLGEVERVTDFEKGMPGAIIEREGKFEPDSLMDDHGLVMNIKGKGLVIITGCAHSGIINTVKYAKKITGVDTVYAIMGGFHLTGPEFILLTEKTVHELEKINPSVIVPMHCTCWVAINWIASRFTTQFRLNSVGTTFCF
ncbi:MAG: dihydropteroate synthase [Deltaproteobacteria bacterium CG12_big_fil_rev_8_21_14_0_65_43_10]|nr:MAG: dihydropteroate synthase [Deltaproteobacteria bacterium CG12_big_fil_rev_8_21_14_0_65_43_10]PIU86829.1 MAG: MBL fold metallo-hydrolase [Deltaproteobacteria bacterium CG06_land_8_20_14_3_00_44_19]PIX26585.1 MAG: MBL fold metallo-hydrolase [Deltaproteobacteria bacterium CG_4_8_14_3_um_filter_43_13]PJB41398.1 MAG: MBL fold metallo-hydrolase [Deltaproteobacteria bacterium CG_4_9_14_3_um_filter_44_9]HCX90489.1 MBL fold metallo-hydrolase [Deltaproteobacteria bacterium]